MPRSGMLIGVLGLALGWPAGAVLADPTAPTPPPTAADAKSGKEPTPAKPRHKPADAAGSTADATSKAAKHKPTDSAAAGKPAHSHATTDKPSPQPTAAATVEPKPAPATAPPPAAAATPKPAGPTCSLEEPEQPRGGRLDVLGNDFGKSPVVRIANKPARMIERRSDRISVQVPADSNGGAITVQSDGRSLACGNLVIIGKNR